MNISNINNFRNVKNDILKCFANAVPQAMDVSVTVARIYGWRNERSEFIIKNILNYKAMLNKMVVNVFIILIKVY